MSNGGRKVEGRGRLIFCSWRLLGVEAQVRYSSTVFISITESKVTMPLAALQLVYHTQEEDIFIQFSYEFGKNCSV